MNGKGDQQHGRRPCAMISYFISAELLDSSKSPLGFGPLVVPVSYSRWHSESKDQVERLQLSTNQLPTPCIPQ